MSFRHVLLLIAVLAGIAPALGLLVGLPAAVALLGVGAAWALLALALALLYRGNSLWRWPAATVAALAFAALAEAAFGVDTGLRGLVFGALAADRTTGLCAEIALFGMAVALLLARRRTPLADVALTVLGMVAVALTASAAALRIVASGPQAIIAGSSFSDMVAAGALFVALLAWRRTTRRSGIFAASNLGSWALRCAFLLVLIAPAGTPVLHVALASTGLLPSNRVGLVALLLHAVLVATLLSLLLHAIGSEHLRLRRAEARLGLAIEAPGVGIFDWDYITGALAWTRTAEEAMGLPPGGMESIQIWRDMVDAADLEGIDATIARVRAARGRHFPFGYHIRAVDGRVRVMEGSARCFYDEQGALVRVIGINLDVTENNAREAQLRSILETVPDAMIVIDEQGLVRDFSATAERMFGYRADQVVGRNVSMLMPASHAAQHDARLARYRMSGIKRFVDRAGAFEARRADGGEFPIELSIGEAWTGGERLFTGFIRDITERVAAEKRLGALNRDYAHAARLSAMGEVAGGLAHELNQPLAACANFLGTARYLLERKPGNEDILTQVEQATGQVHRAGEIIRRLRGFIAKTDVEMRVELLADTIHEALALALVGSRHFDINVDIDLAPEASWVFADRIQVQQVLVNLLRNAAEAVRACPPEERRIQVRSTVVDRDWVEVSVSDAGPGFPAAMLSQLYAPFLSTKGSGGLGLGLSICRRIVESHGGTMRVANAPEGGACIAFTLPAAPVRPLP